ncbi:ATP synthase subunit I [Pseudomonas sp. SA3-5]|uniref:ATP synthase subunit I n=1 Tax=Pseudomonas aestuarii TaxID=3018340 RepID=A0ABT4XLJ2_9PSED|nr:ATP synthase subunit I [Pseudomonas aestuarii]MDA7089040.1 ATP synthase subunit I [Pseudomonas aestuarii]
MSMNEIIFMALAGVAGSVLGAVFFAGLWWTLRRGLASSRPALWFFSSLLLRLSLTLAGFYWVAGDDWRRLLACLLGFLLARLLVTRLTRPAHPPAGISPGEVSHAP